MGGTTPAGTARVADLPALRMGRSLGGLTTKIHAVTDAHGLPITLKLTAGQADVGNSADDMLGTVGPGQTLLADAASDGNRLREQLATIGARAVIRPIARSSAPPRLDRDACRRRNRIFFPKLTHSRAIATRHEKHDANFIALVKRAATRIWVRAYESVF
jgi:transposase